MHKKLKFIPLLLILFSGTRLWAQQAPENGQVVMYDPLFWRDELRIRGDQAHEIEQINIEFYQELLTAYKSDPANPDFLSTAVAENTRLRNQKILDVFQPRQLKKWEKIRAEYHL